MSVKYVLLEKRNPMAPEEPKKFYAQAKSSGSITLRALAKKITQRCTVNAADTVAVLEALSQLLTEELAEGKIVRFGDFGSFQITLGSEGADTEEKFHQRLIRNIKVRFRPGIALKEMIRNLVFERTATAPKKTTGPEEKTAALLSPKSSTGIDEKQYCFWGKAPVLSEARQKALSKHAPGGARSSPARAPVTSNSTIIYLLIFLLCF